MSADQQATGPLAGSQSHPRDWNAASYHKVSGPQQRWAAEQFERLQLRGDEVLLDAGCGSGKVTEQLLALIPDGRLYAVDAAPSMVEHTKQLLGDKATVLCQDLVELSLPEPVDAVFSNATFHWIPDHDRLFGALAANMKPGAQLVAQFGGKGNIERLRAVADRIGEQQPFARYFSDWQVIWRNFQDAEATAERLRTAGFEQIECWLTERPTEPEHPREFLQTVCLLPHLERLPEDLRDRYLDEVLAAAGTPLVLDYVRCNVVARRAADTTGDRPAATPANPTASVKEP